MNEDKELEVAIGKVNKIRLNFYDKQYKKSYTDDELTDMCDSLSTILQYIQYDSISKKKIKDKIEELKRKELPNGRLDLDIRNEAQIQVLQKLLED